MNHIGNIIKTYRKESGISRASLSKNICSEKYIYLIEKGERSPSPEMTRMLGEKMGVNLFDFYQYLDCAEPIKVLENMKLFKIYRRKANLPALKEVTDAAMHLPDFQKKPLICEIKINELLFMIYIQRRYKNAIEEMARLILETQGYYDSCTVALYELLCWCYKITGDLQNAKSTLLKAKELLKNKYNETNSWLGMNSAVLSLLLNYSSGKYKAIIQEGKKFLQQPMDIDFYERSFYFDFYLSFAYYKTERHDDAIEHFKKGIYTLLVHNKPIEVHYLSSVDIFHVLLNDGNMNQETASEFKQKYNID